MAALLIIQATVSRDSVEGQHYREYQTQVQPLIAAHGGRLRATGGLLEVLEGSHDGRRLVVFEFPSMQALHDFWHSPQYAVLKTLRANAALVVAWAVPAQ